MNKWKISLMGLVTITGLPLSNLVSCSNQNISTCTIRFANGGGGTIEGETSIDVQAGSKWQDVAKPSTNPDGDHVFAGWYLGDTLLQDSDEISTDRTWVVVARFNPMATDKCRVSFVYGDGGKIVDGDTEIEVEKNKPWADVIKPTWQADEGYSFAGWFLNNQKLQDSDPVVSSMSVVCRFTQNVKHTISLFAAGGVFDLGTEQKETIDVEVDGNETFLGKVLENVKSPIKEDHIFAYWVDWRGKFISKSTLVTSDLQLTAVYVSYKTKCLIDVANPVEDGFSIDIQEAPLRQDLTVHISSKTPIETEPIQSITIGTTTIGPGQFDFQVDTHNPKKGILFIEGSLISGNVKIQFNKPTIPVPMHFEIDPWPTIAYYADQGLDSLCEAYECESQDLLGKTRSINLNNHKHMVTVVGINQDKFTVGTEEKTAALTFQFYNVISKQSDGSALTVIWDKSITGKSVGHYWDSGIAKVLNNTDSVNWNNDTTEHRSVLTMIQDTDPNKTWVNSIKQINRLVNTYSSSKWKPTQKAVKIFLPTLSNLYSSEGLLSASSEEDIRESVETIEAEGQSNMETKQYELLHKYIGDSPAGGSLPQTSLIHIDCLGLSYGYWLSTNYFYDSEGLSPFVYTLQNNGAIDREWVYTGKPVAPCFCL